MFSKQNLFLALSIALFSGIRADSTPSYCYYPDGNLASDYLPCTDTSGGATSWCCQLSTSVCTQNGYCVGSNGLFYRGGCTDSTWTSPSCPQLCKNDNAETFSTFFNCADPGTYSQTWCCSTGSADGCCSAGFSIDFGNPFQPNATSTVYVSVAASTSLAVSTGSSSSATPTSSMSTAFAAGAAIPSTSSSSSSSGSSNDTIIGVGVGVGLGVGLLAIAAVLYTIFTQRRKRQVAEKRLDEKIQEVSAEAAQTKIPLEEVDGREMKYRHEAGPHERYELGQGTAPLGR